MKRLNSILLMAFLLIVSGCGMTDVWKDWEDEGTPDPNRMKPSELKATLCEADCWKITYSGLTFYFQFDSDGYVISNTDKNLLEPEVESDYHFDFENQESVNLTISDGGALKYVLGNAERTFKIVEFTDQEVKAEYGDMNFTLVRIDKAEFDNGMEQKRLAIIERNKALFYQYLNSDFYNGVIRDDKGKFIAHYAISGQNKDQIRISVLENRVLTHHDSGLTITTDDNNAMLNFDAVSLNGKTTTKILYSFEDNSIGTDSKLSVTSNKGPISFFTGSSYQTYIISKNNNKGDAKEVIWNETGWRSVGDIELSNRAERPLVFCGGPENGIGYTFFDANLVLGNEFDRIYFNKTAGYMPYGGVDRVSEVEQKMTNFLAGWFHADGLYLIQETVDSLSFIYFISPTTDTWFKFQR